MRLSARVLFTVSLALAAALAPAERVNGQDLLSNLTVDNFFYEYLSTSPTATGALLQYGSAWENTYTNLVGLVPGQHYWIHVDAYDQGGIAAFIGSFSVAVAAPGFQFTNGQQTLDTDVSHWLVSAVGFGIAESAPVVQNGANGVAPWGFRYSISPSADWIWSSDDCTNCERYFSTEIVPVSATPEPASVVLMLTGIVGLVPLARRRKNG